MYTNLVEIRRVISDYLLAWNKHPELCTIVHALFGAVGLILIRHGILNFKYDYSCGAACERLTLLLMMPAYIVERLHIANYFHPCAANIVGDENSIISILWIWNEEEKAISIIHTP